MLTNMVSLLSILTAWAEEVSCLGGIAALASVCQQPLPIVTRMQGRLLS